MLFSAFLSSHFLYFLPQLHNLQYWLLFTVQLTSPLILLPESSSNLASYPQNFIPPLPNSPQNTLPSRIFSDSTLCYLPQSHSSGIHQQCCLRSPLSLLFFIHAQSILFYISFSADATTAEPEYFGSFWWRGKEEQRQRLIWGEWWSQSPSLYSFIYNSIKHSNHKLRFDKAKRDSNCFSLTRFSWRACLRK